MHGHMEEYLCSSFSQVTSALAIAWPLHPFLPQCKQLGTVFIAANADGFSGHSNLLTSSKSQVNVDNAFVARRQLSRHWQLQLNACTTHMEMCSC